MVFRAVVIVCVCHARVYIVVTARGVPVHGVSSSAWLVPAHKRHRQIPEEYYVSCMITILVSNLQWEPQNYHLHVFNNSLPRDTGSTWTWCTIIKPFYTFLVHLTLVINKCKEKSSSIIINKCISISDVHIVLIFFNVIINWWFAYSYFQMILFCEVVPPVPVLCTRDNNSCVSERESCCCCCCGGG